VSAALRREQLEVVKIELSAARTRLRLTRESEPGNQNAISYVESLIARKEAELAALARLVGVDAADAASTPLPPRAHQVAETAARLEAGGAAADESAAATAVTLYLDEVRLGIRPPVGVGPHGRPLRRPAWTAPADAEELRARRQALKDAVAVLRDGRLAPSSRENYEAATRVLDDFITFQGLSRDELLSAEDVECFLTHVFLVQRRTSSGSPRAFRMAANRRNRALHSRTAACSYKDPRGVVAARAAGGARRE